MNHDIETATSDGLRDRAPGRPAAGPPRQPPRGAMADRLYDRLIRDFCARVVPGLMLLIALAVSVASVEEVTAALERANPWMWLALLGAGWLTSFAILAIGRRFNLVVFSTDALTEQQYWAAEERFRANAPPRRRAAYDRVITIRDAAAAASVSLFLSLGTLAVDFVVDVHLHENPWNEIRNGAAGLAVLIALGVALQLVHREHVRKAWQYLAMTGAGESLTKR